MDTPDGERWQYRYDAFGRRTAKQCSTPTRKQAPRQHFLWLGSKLIERWDWRDADQATPDAPATPPSVTRWHYRSGSFTPLAQETLRQPDDPASQCYPLASDPNGSPHTLFASNGDILWRASHTLWGAAVPAQLAALTPHWGSSANHAPDCPLRFAGQWHDAESGLHYNLHRYYDPASGQYLSPDPLGLAGGLRTHAYVHDPLQWIDPWGLIKCGLTGNDVGDATNLPIIKPGTPLWKQAVNTIKNGGKSNFRTANKADAEKLLTESKGSIEKMDTYTETPYKRGYENHPNEQNTANAPENNLPHIKWKDWSTGKSSGGTGHIFHE
ncbi:RHS repeat-associated core domain-containing protein [Chitinilyticum litopenaei]|uniref:RHS repeat-associated core domain-containing protein n=1 Tax=Chitinilyticum litopenaei TaxID=1121276 RepID=UPI0003F4DF3E